jgi:AraC family transcriptional regulator, regulatory protein of adaptative response / methylated-DNA-[protein]-cysteine methyltransferase
MMVGIKRYAEQVMLAQTTRQEYYQALLQRDPTYDGVFYVGVATTGVFCHPTCPARKPKFTNCTFHETAQEALLAGYRPCKRCQPLSHPSRVPPIVAQLVAAVEAQPEKRWRAQDVRDMYIDPSTARRLFRQRFGMTFIAYARARRMGLALQHIRKGASVIETQITTGYESGSGFRDAFTRIMGDAPARAGDGLALQAAWLDTQLGPMLAVADEDAVHMLEFVDRRGLEREVARMRKALGAAIVPGNNAPLRAIAAELEAYFAGELRQFETPLVLHGSDFQREVWRALLDVPYGETRSYLQIAEAIGNPAAVRAVGRANGANQIAIVIPCHRVIGADGSLTGYGGGMARKRWLLDHEAGRRGLPLA